MNATKTIREQVQEKITPELAMKWAIRNHTHWCSMQLEVYPDGDLNTSQLDDNSWHVLPNSRDPVETLYRIRNGNIPCNCDWCHEFREHVDADRINAEHMNEDGEYEDGYEPIEKWNEEDEYDFIRDCVYDNGGSSYIEDEMRDNLDHIPYGYFEDEED